MTIDSFDWGGTIDPADQRYRLGPFRLGWDHLHASGRTGTLTLAIRKHSPRRSWFIWVPEGHPDLFKAVIGRWGGIRLSTRIQNPDADYGRIEPAALPQRLLPTALQMFHTTPADRYCFEFTHRRSHERMPVDQLPGFTFERLGLEYQEWLRDSTINPHAHEGTVYWRSTVPLTWEWRNRLEP